MNQQLTSTKFLSPQELDRLGAILDRFERTNPRDVLMIRLLLNTGARSCELLALRIQDINFEAQSIRLKSAKGSNEREIPLSAALFAQLYQYCTRHPDGPLRHHNNQNTRLFPLAARSLRSIWDQYRPVKKGAHCLRHTFAILLYQRTKDLRLVKVALGHRSVANTMIYADYDYQLTELRRLLL